MKKTDITFVTIVLDGAENIKNYINCVKKGHAEGFKFICIDGDSKDGTKEILKANKQLFDYFISEKDDGFYFALNKAIKRVKTAYYLVFGIDDEIDFKNIQKTLYDIKRYKYELICGSVLLNDSKIKKAKGKFLLSKYLGWGNFISHHSVGTIIATRLHSRYGYYSHHFSLLSDGFFIQNLIKNKEPHYISDNYFGNFSLGGMSSRDFKKSATEKFIIMTKIYNSFWIQFLILNLRLLYSKFRV